MESTNNNSRRNFIKTTGATLAATTVGMNMGYGMPLFQRTKNEVLKVGLIGCGGRGTGAAVQALHADPDVHLTAMGDIFPDKLEKSYNSLVDEHGARVKVSPDQIGRASCRERG